MLQNWGFHSGETLTDEPQPAHNYKNNWGRLLPSSCHWTCLCKPTAASGAHKLVEVVLAGLGTGLLCMLRVPK